MQPFTVVTGAAAPLLLPNVDTDVIIRIEPLTTHPADALGPFAFEPLRYRPDGSEDPDFVLNQPPFRDAPILLAGPNFGCGSSREAAVWALMGRGLRCVVAPSFGDIFHGNCFQNGMLPVVLDEQRIAALAAVARTGAPMTVDLVRCELSIAGLAAMPFHIDASRRLALLEGLDAIGLTLKHADAITAWQEADRLLRPWAWAPVRRAARTADPLPTDPSR